MSSLRRVTVSTFLGFEIVFKLVFVRAFGNAFAPDGDHAWITRLYIEATIPVGLVWLLAIWILTSRYDRIGANDDAHACAVQAQRRLPDLLTIAWAANWVSTLVLVAVRVPTIVSHEAVICLLGSILLGSTVLAHTFTSWVVESRRLGDAPQRRMFDGAAPRSLRLRLLGYGLGLGLAPTMYLGGLTFSVRLHPMTRGEVLTEVLLQAGATAGFAVASAVLISLTIIGPVRRMASIMQTVAAGGEYTKLDRLPVLRNDELGTLSEATNQMLDRLEHSDRERLALYETLEHKVEERTERLRQANEQIARDFEERTRMELELRQAQRLEAVGRLAAGIAHEINTPLQFVSDSLQFVRAGTGDVLQLATDAGRIARGTDSPVGPANVDDDDDDLAYLRDQLPQAIERALEGLGRVTTIVRSMKAFAHPDRSTPVEVDLNATITNTLTVARNEYKYVADLETDFGDLPRVTCWVGDFNQVIVNLVVNAAHAIGEIVGTSGNKGKIKIATRCEGDDAIVEIADTGGGIPESARDFIFEPFFTTKEIGKGTGQGLAIARSVIVEKHHGTIDFASTSGVGTTFTIRIPIAGAYTNAPQAA